MPSPIFHHEPVLVAEVLAHLAPAAGRHIVDATLGGGGHAERLLAGRAEVLGLDQDPEALAFATSRLEKFGNQFHAAHANFSDAPAVLASYGWEQIDGALLDLGVSSWQLEAPHRGFSFQTDGPLDMRMDATGAITAADLVNFAPAEQLEQIFREFGEEPSARRIVQRLVRARAVRPFATTLALAREIEETVPRRGRAHPATRVFQALRIAVNRELEVLPTALRQFARLLRPGGRLAVITFHSLEDRLVKNYFRDHSREWIDRPEWPAARPNPDREFKLLTPKAVAPSADEQQRNPRSRSAKLRVVEKL